MKGSGCVIIICTAPGLPGVDEKCLQNIIIKTIVATSIIQNHFILRVI
jgi:hypothetical protein